MKFSDLQYDTELGESWRPKRDYGTVAQKLAPWAIGITTFCVVVSLAIQLQRAWPGSPLFFLVRLVGRILMTIVSLLLGVVRWFTTGNSDLLANSTESFSGEYSHIFSPLIFGIVFTIIALRIARRTGFKRSTCVALLIAAIVLPSLMLASQKQAGLARWFIDFWQLLQALWGT